MRRELLLEPLHIFSHGLLSLLPAILPALVRHGRGLDRAAAARLLIELAALRDLDAVPEAAIIQVFEQGCAARK